ncbi:alpha/beta fold hydrolase [Micromonospora sp. NPDC047557]|uniref:alpha/beta fold hydrolase n=1 Tax=Micromonospora sp. NPDC047557 TaxID=3364250 RepID=UPI003718635F
MVGATPTYYEVHGSGQPLLLLHGGMCTLETMEAQLSGLATGFQVIAAERRGHGRTPDVPGPITYAAMAEDTLLLMDALGIASAHVVGWSDGAMVGLRLALLCPERVRSLVFMGQSVTLEGMRPGVVELLRSTTPAMLPAALVAGYAKLSPDGPQRLDTVLSKMRVLWGEPTGVTLADLGGLAVPALVLIGDADLVLVEHALAVQSAMPRARLGVVPGAAHTMPADKPDLVNRIILDFLTGL